MRISVSAGSGPRCPRLCPHLSTGRCRLRVHVPASVFCPFPLCSCSPFPSLHALKLVSAVYMCGLDLTLSPVGASESITRERPLLACRLPR